MAAPTKIEREKREKIKELGLFVRDSYMYRTIENSNKDNAPYLFCILSDIRNNVLKNNDLIIDREKKISFHQDFYLGNGYNFVNEYKNISTQNVISLKEIDSSLCNYFQHIWYEGSYKISAELLIVDREPYFVQTNISIKELNDILGQERVNEIINNVYNYFSDMNKFVELESIHSELTTEDKKKLYKHFIKKGGEPKTFIMNRMNYQNTGGLERQKPENTIFLELDFTKPLNDLIENITKIKNDFNENPKTISNFYGLLGFETHNTTFNDLGLYMTNNIKPLSGRLADILFIYDCRKAGLDNNYILKEINKYWTETKNLFKDEMQLKTLREYHNLAIDYIDNEKYKCYLSGYDIPKEK